MRSLGWDLIQYDAFTKKGNLDSDIDVSGGKMMWRHIERRQPCTWSYTSVSHGKPRIASRRHKLEVARKDSPLELSKRAWLWWNLGVGLVDFRTFNSTFTLFHATPFLVLCYSSPRKVVHFLFFFDKELSKWLFPAPLLPAFHLLSYVYCID